LIELEPGRGVRLEFPSGHVSVTAEGSDVLEDGLGDLQRAATDRTDAVPPEARAPDAAGREVDRPQLRSVSTGPADVRVAMLELDRTADVPISDLALPLAASEANSAAVRLADEMSPITEPSSS